MRESRRRAHQRRGARERPHGIKHLYCTGISGEVVKLTTHNSGKTWDVA